MQIACYREEMLTKGFDAGTDGHAAKPIGIAGLMQTLAGVMGQS